MRVFSLLALAAVLAGGQPGPAWAQGGRATSPKAPAAAPTVAPTKEPVRVTFSIGGVT